MMSVPRHARNMAMMALYVDKKVVVLNKPPGIVSQPTAAAANTDRDPDQKTSTQRLPVPVPVPVSQEAAMTRALDDITQTLHLRSRPLPVHRLDKATTGALLLARTPHAAKDLARQFTARAVHKTYLALVRGGRQTFGGAAQGEVSVGLRVDVDGRVSVRRSGGREARTGWEVLHSSPDAPLSLLRLTLHTGVKHQLRVHLAHALNAPILGDELYSRSAVSDKIRAIVPVLPRDRLFLHASHISFLRYHTWGPQFRLGITAPLPADFLHICTQAGFALDARAVHGGVTVDGVPTVPGDVQLEGRWLGPSSRDDLEEGRGRGRGQGFGFGFSTTNT